MTVGSLAAAVADAAADDLAPAAVDIPAAVAAGLVGPAEAIAAGIGLTVFFVAGFFILKVKETPPCHLPRPASPALTTVSTPLPRRGWRCMQENPKLTNDDPPIIRQRMAYVGFVCVASVVAVYAFYSSRGVLGFAVRAPRAARPVHDRRAQSAPCVAPRRTPVSLSPYGSVCVWTACWRRWCCRCCRWPSCSWARSCSPTTTKTCRSSSTSACEMCTRPSCPSRASATTSW